MTIVKQVIPAFLLCISVAGDAQQKAIVSIDLARKGAVVSPDLHGVFFEEISHAGEGGIYAELIQNRGFEEANIPNGMHREGNMIVPPATPHFMIPGNKVSDWKMEWNLVSDYPAWSAKENGNASMKISRTGIQPLNEATPHSLQIDLAKADGKNYAEVINEGFWGINVEANENYLLNFYLRSNNYKGSVIAMLKDEQDHILAKQVITPNGRTAWKKYSTTLTATASGRKAKFVLAFNNTGTVWLDFVSLFPQHTFNNRPNGLRKDLAEYIAALKPAFIRWPGGCFVEGITIQSAPDWKQSIGPVEKRPGSYSPWGYYSSDGFGYHEYLQYCEDIGAAALYVFNAGVSCEYRSGTYVSEDSMQPYIQSALDAIEYAIGPATGKWGKLRAAAGHPKPFPLKYVEVGNEQHGPRYAERYNVFYKAIKARFPQMKIMASMGIGDVNDHTLRKMEQVDFVDEHAYKGAGWAMTNFDHFDKYKRGKWQMYVGEYATNAGVGSGNMEAALNDAVYIMAMEKNSDLVKMSSYAPLLVNTNDVDWPVNLINFDNAASFARISYYAIKMMNENKPDVNVAAKVTMEVPAVKKASFSGGIGLATWDTKTAYKDIEIIAEGKTVYHSDINSLNDWGFLRGKWEVKDSSLVQTAEGAQQFAMLKNKSFDTYTLKLKAKKIDGYNAFIIPFAVKDSNTFYRAHIGAWVNKISVFEKVSNGYDVSNISSPVNLPDTIAANRWYDVRLEVGTDTVKCFLDDKLLMTFTEPGKLFSIAGTEEKSGDIIVKVVNGYGAEMPVDIQLENTAQLSETANVTTLSAPALTDENSYEHPAQFIPVSTTLPANANGLSFRAKPFSINIIRFKEKR